ncbi:MAG: replication-associated recombination protein A [bacterium]
MQPLAFRIRPTKFEDIIGQDHLVGPKGIIKKMIDNNQLFSMILHGAPGIGKTSIAKIISSYFSLNVFEFNASVDNKDKLKEISTSASFYENTVLIIDEIHRMKKDIQDYLLPSVEEGKLTIIGLTTENPYHSVNKAIRSRVHIYKLNDIKQCDVSTLLKKVAEKEFSTNVESEVFDYLAHASNCEIRTALNMLEILCLNEENVSLENAKNVIGKPSLDLDKNGDSYYDCLSALQKSIRGSDVDAALHYLARLIVKGDLDIIFRRLTIIAYEDIGLGNPSIGPKVMAAIEACRATGLPEGRIPLSVVVVEMALSPKSNSAYSALDEAIVDFTSGITGKIPPNILNREIVVGNAKYKFPHDYEEGFVKQQYLPSGIPNKVYYKPKLTGKYERAFKERLEQLNKMKK